MTAAELRARAREHEAVARLHEEQARECRRRVRLDVEAAAMLDLGIDVGAVVTYTLVSCALRGVLVGHDGVSPLVRRILTDGTLGRAHSAWSVTPTGERWEGEW